MKKSILLSILFLSIFGCGAINQTYTSITDNLTYKCAKTGVIYAQSNSGLALLVDKNGKPVECKV